MRARAAVLAALVTVSVAVPGAARAAAREPWVRPGVLLVTTVRGFAPHAAVAERLDRTVVRRVHADRHGAVTLRVRAPRPLGHHRLIVVGRAPDARHRRDPLVARVPRVVIIAFRVSRRGRGGLGVADENAGAPPPTTRPGAPGRTSGGTAGTGGDLSRPVGLAAALLAAGLVLAAAGRRRRESDPVRPAVR